MNVNKTHLPIECLKIIIENLDELNKVYCESVCSLWKKVILDLPAYQSQKESLKEITVTIKKWDPRVIKAFGGFHQIRQLPINHNYSTSTEEFVCFISTKLRVERGFDGLGRAFFCFPTALTTPNSSVSCMPFAIVQRYLDVEPIAQWGTCHPGPYFGAFMLEDRDFANIEKLISEKIFKENLETYTLLEDGRDWNEV